MLVLTRKLQQQIKIGEQVTVTILRVKGNTVRVGVEAPRDVRVVRGELPKVDRAAPSADSVDDEAAHGTDGGRVDASAKEPEPVESSLVPSPAHLPLRKIKSRYGKGPLKQIVAACGALAK